MKTCVLAGIVLVIVLTTLLWAQPSKKELTSTPRYMGQPAKPVFETATPEAVSEAIHVVSSRSTAVFGFNTPVVRIYLPRIENSAYAIIEFDEPLLSDGNGKRVDYTVERSGYLEDLHADEIRFVSQDGSDAVVFTRAKGKGRIKFPIEIATEITRLKDRHLGRAAAVINGPFVTYRDQNIPEMIFQHTRIGPVRAYDTNGRQLEEQGYNATETTGDATRRTLAFWGDIAEVHIDTVTRWAEIVFTYDLPPIEPLPESYSGQVVSRPPKITATPGGSVSVSLVQADKPPPKESASQGSQEKAKADLQFFHYALAMPTSTENEAVIRKLIKAGADVNAIGNGGNRALHVVAYRCDAVGVVKALIEAGADVNAQTTNGLTPLWFAQQMKCREVERILIEAGAK